MAGVGPDDLDETSRNAWLSLRDALSTILGDDLVAIWAHGGTTAVEDGPHVADLDTYVIIGNPPDAEVERQIVAAHDEVGRDCGVEWDAWYVLEADARQPEQPRHAFHPERRDTSWAIHRAHWLAGRFVPIHGPDPQQLVPPPTWPEVQRELDRELEHIERHVVEGDSDPFEATYAILNGSRILHTVETGSVEISKRAAGTWALEHLPARWHPAIQAALRAYVGQATPDDEELLAAKMAPFVAFVREALPALDDRPVDAPPRWSGF